ncbi:MAG TPA: glycosyltransferase family 39 protein [Thermoanaerobaculia bacterium]|nr:glycosyltransferase family 39 protein [Thermoanaerobaculia bacterium]
MTTRRRLLFVALGSLALKALVLARLHDHPLLQPRGGLDGDAYLDVARRIASGDILLASRPEPFFLAPLYAYFLAPILALSAGSLMAVQLVQILLGALAVFLAGDTARRLFGDEAAAPAAILLALCGVVTFHESLILQAALDPFLTAATLWLLAVALEAEPAPKRFLAAGVALGLLAVNRPNVLPWAAVAALGIFFSYGRPAGAKRAGAFLLGVALVLAPAAARNLAVSHEPVLISSHGGLNLYIGNGPGAEGVYRLVDDITPNIAGQASDARLVAEREERRPLDARGVSRHFARKAFAWMRQEPARAARLFARKIRYVIAEDEAPLNFSVHWYRRQSVWLAVSFVGPAVLVPLGGTGLALGLLGAARIPVRRFAVVASFVVSYAVLVALFFVATRYRIPLLVALAPLAGGAVASAVDMLREGRRRRVLLGAAVALPLLALSLWPTGLDDGSAEEETQWALHLAPADPAAAWRTAQALEARHPLPGVLWFRLGQAFGAAGRTEDGIAALERSLAIDPRQPETERVLGAAREARGLALATSGRLDEAARELTEAVRLLPASAPARLNLAAVLAEKGDRARAEALAKEALALQPGYQKAEALLNALGARGR